MTPMKAVLVAALIVTLAPARYCQAQAVGVFVPTGRPSLVRQKETSDRRAIERYQSVVAALRKYFYWQGRLKKLPQGSPRFASLEEAERVIEGLVRQLGDKFTYYENAQKYRSHPNVADRRDVVEWRMLEGDIGYVRIKVFSSNHTSEEVIAALKGLGHARALVLDLRDNTGGYVKQGFQVFDVLANRGVYTTLQRPGPRYVEVSVATGDYLETRINGKLHERIRRVGNLSGERPMVVLVNSATASVAEMLTGALLTHKRAVVIGQRTYGKGICQTHVKFDDGAIVQVTSWVFSLPDGRNIHGVGITPTRFVKSTNGQGGDNQLEEAVKLLEEKLRK